MYCNFKQNARITCLTISCIILFVVNVFFGIHIGINLKSVNQNETVPKLIPSQHPDFDPLSSLKDIAISVENEKAIFSQNGEDGIIDTIFKQIGTTDKYYVEFGTENGDETNTRNLRENHQWNGLLMDGSHQNSAINLHKEFIYESNIVQLFEKHNVSKHFDLLSTDTDFKDFWISQAILNADYKPRVIISEINASFNKKYALSVPLYIDQKLWSGSNYFGATPMAFTILYKKYDYSLVYCEKNGVNCFWIHNDYLSNSDKSKFNQYQHILDTIKCANYFDTGKGHPKDSNPNNWYQQIVPLSKINEFYITKFEMNNKDLDLQRCQ